MDQSSPFHARRQRSATRREQSYAKVVIDLATAGTAPIRKARVSRVMDYISQRH